jgi:hypothetical protein
MNLNLNQHLSLTDTMILNQHLNLNLNNTLRLSGKST